MRRLIKIFCILTVFVPLLYAVPFQWESKADEPAFIIDVPASWARASRARNGVGNVHFEKKGVKNRVAIEIRTYTSEDTDVEQLILALRTRLAVKYDRLYLKKRQEMKFRKGVEKQLWTARVGKVNYTLITAFIVQDSQVLEISCIAPSTLAKNFQIIFDNALLSLNFPDGSEGGASNTPAEETTPAPAEVQPVSPSLPVTPPAPGKPPTIEF
ncbi:MAG: hypothetical protein LDLANPLL_02750 [Turneriella sp.]|nr:hypothetical protein [Turneriella sp.]